ncbi:transcriptional regulator, AraC family [Shewanella halifaxensis HAW-EB4]|uniref:Transcriptional regulator, AraC family n=1 Tax=Shewanella halifaxensis (strain HAW-EB4) TaxID=458817 RepID=B0TLM3_SHEHH|nr:helix-turn-helix domain-containing protein [Shewanella halifaxensis]ABZ75973.1 transcriptional regulator, AraC family [Shewanella halifaxensis HAW-EB4]
MNIPNVMYRERHEKMELFSLESFTQRSKLYSPAPSDLHRVDFHCLLRHKSHGSHCIDFKNYEYKPGDMVYIAPGQVHAYDFNNTPCGEVIIFTKAYYQEIKSYLPDDPLQLCKQAPVWQPDQALSEIIDRTLELIDLQQHSALPSISNKLLFTNLLVNISQTQKKFITEPQQKFKYQELITLVYNNMNTTRHAKDYAKLMAMSYSKLNNICLKASGNTLKRSIDNQIILEAKRILVTESLNINQLSEHLGFDETTNFVKFFNRHTGISPKQFRQHRL